MSSLKGKEYKRFEDINIFAKMEVNIGMPENLLRLWNILNGEILKTLSRLSERVVEESDNANIDSMTGLMNRRS